MLAVASIQTGFERITSAHAPLQSSLSLEWRVKKKKQWRRALFIYLSCENCCHPSSWCGCHGNQDEAEAEDCVCALLHGVTDGLGLCSDAAGWVDARSMLCTFPFFSFNNCLLCVGSFIGVSNNKTNCI